MKALPIIFIFILLAPIALASTLYREDFSNIQSQTFNLQEKDAIRVFYDNTTAEIMLNDVYPEKSSVKLTLFIEDAATPQYVSLKTNANLYVDINKDRVKDLVIRAHYISMNNTILSITPIKADDEINNPQPAAGTAEKTAEEPQTTKSPSLQTGIIITASVIALGLIIYFLLRKKH